MIRPRNLELGIIKIQLSGVVVKVTDPERIIVDSFKYLDGESCGIWKANFFPSLNGKAFKDTIKEI